MIKKVTDNLENFNYNVIIANIHEIYNFLSKEIEKNYDSLVIKENYLKILTLLTPTIPHYTSECIEDLGVTDNIWWPETNNDVLVEKKVDYVIQINGKKRLILNENRDMNQESLLVKLKTNKISQKYLKDKSINKIIFIKNRLMNLLINE